MRIQKVIVPVCLMAFTLSCQVNSELNTPHPTPPISKELDTDLNEETTPDTHLLPTFTTSNGNQKLASGDRLGWGITLNQVNNQGNGAILWSLGEPVGVRFENFKPMSYINRGTLPSEGLRWLVDSEGNGLLLETEITMSVGFDLSPGNSKIWTVQNFSPIGKPMEKPGESIGMFQTDSTGNGWIMINRPDPNRQSNEPFKTLNTVYRLQNYRLDETSAITQSAEYGDVMDLNGNGFRVYTEPDSFRDRLWFQEIKTFQKAGEPVLLSNNGGNYRLYQQAGEGALIWLDRDDLNRPITTTVRRIHNFALTRDLYTRKGAEGVDSPLPLAVSISKDGNGFVAWNTFVPVGQPPFGQALVLQVVKNFVPKEDHLISGKAATTFGSVYLHSNAEGKGLLVWTETPQIMNAPFISNTNMSLNSVNIEQWLPEKEAHRISDASLGSVDASSVKLTNEGNGMISWTQFNETCPSETQCNLAQTVWSKPIVQFREQ